MTETRIQFNLATTPAPVISPPLYCCNNKVHFILPFYVRAVNAFPPTNSLGRRPFTFATTALLGRTTIRKEFDRRTLHSLDD